jgi:hypothetical protein
MNGRPIRQRLTLHLLAIHFDTLAASPRGEQHKFATKSGRASLAYFYYFCPIPLGKGVGSEWYLLDKAWLDSFA